MAAGTEKDKDSASAASQVFLTEDIITNHILLQLPTASCIARCRCVCKSWRALLSDPQFIRRIIFFQTPADQQSLQILIAGPEKGVKPARKIYYSLHSYETLCPVFSETGEDDHLHLLPSIPYKMRARWPEFRLDIVGCCDGIFCISDVNHGGASDVILWNPTTSEIKYLPLSPCPHHISLEARNQCTGFGFDPVTRDYKVVRRMEFQRNDGPRYDDYREDRDDYEAPEFIYQEVYSLKNNSWRRNYAQTRYYCDDDCNYVFQYRPDTSRNEKCYWLHNDYEGNCRITSFHLSTEVFESVQVPLPASLGDKSELCIDSCFLLKETFVVTLSSFQYDRSANKPYEIWGLMNGAPATESSWTKLFTYQLSPDIANNTILEVWKDEMYICSLDSEQYDKIYSTSDHADEEVDRVYILDPTMCKIDNRLDLEGKTHQFQVHAYTPTQVSLSSLE